MQKLSLDDAYKEACQALGESIVRERFLVKELDALTPVKDEKSADDQSNGQG